MRAAGFLDTFLHTQAVRDVMRVRNIEESSKGCVKPKDFLVGVEEDDVSQWPLLRSNSYYPYTLCF